MPVNKVDSNVVGLSFAEEQSLKTLPAQPTWYKLEPNTFGDFGAQVKTTPRNFINASRQRFKGNVTGVDAAAAFNNDLTQTNLHQLLPGFFFAAWREKTSTAVTAVDDLNKQFDVAAGGAAYVAGDLILASGMGVAANNGLRSVTGSAAGTITVAEVLTAEANPPTDALIKKVGFEFTAGDATIDVTGAVKSLVTVTKDLTTLGLIPGEWIYLGGDAVGTQFLIAGNNGFARVQSVAAHKVVLDKTQGVMATDAAAGKTIRVFFGDVVKNESDTANQVTKSFQFERDLDAGGLEYLLGAIANQMTINMPTEDKITVDLNFIALDAEYVAAATGPKAGTRAAADAKTVFNTSSDFSRLRLAETDDTGLATYLQDLKLSINNNAKSLKALGQLGGFDISVGDFTVNGTASAYFTDVATIEAIRNNADVTLDFVAVNNNCGMLFDLPLVGLSDGRAAVAKDTPVMLNLTQDAFADPVLDHTLLCVSFDYLPTVAAA